MRSGHGGSACGRFGNAQTRRVSAAKASAISKDGSRPTAFFYVVDKDEADGPIVLAGIPVNNCIRKATRRMATGLEPRCGTAGCFCATLIPEVDITQALAAPVRLARRALPGLWAAGQ